MERVDWSTDINPTQDARDWQTSDLCEQCQDVDLDKVLVAPIPSHLREAFVPLCRFYARLVPAEYQLQPGEVTNVSLQRWARDPDYLFVNIDVPLAHTMDFKRNGEMKIVPIEKAESGGSRFVDIHSQSIDYGVLKNWISHCEASHSKFCRESQLNSLEGTKVKLIDCHSRTVTVQGQGGRYVALSYVWGPPEQGHSPGDPKAALRDLNGKSIQVSNVIQDAITVTIRLGLQYLWVDQVCIDQDDAEEKHQQLHCMDSIYNQAFLTIVAAAGDRASYGLPGVGTRSRTIRPRISLNGITWTAYHAHYWKEVSASTWNTRGWTFQERFFSRRFLMFTDEQVIFECGGMLQTEDRVRHLDAPRTSWGINDLQNIIKRCNPKSHPQSLMSLIETSTRRSLTKEDDILESMGGIFNFHSQLKPPIESFWGLPIRWLGYWMMKQDLDAYRAGDSDLKHEDIAGAILLGLQWHPKGKRPVTRREGFPSWSWSGWKTAVIWEGNRSSCGKTPSGITFPMHVVTTTNELVAINEAFARSLASGRSYQTLGYTQTLRFDAQVLEVPFVKWEDYEGRSSYSKDLPIGYMMFTFGGDSVPFAVVKSIGPSCQEQRPDKCPSSLSSTSRGLVWPLFLTCSTADTEDIWKDPDNKTIECVVLGHEYGLLIQTRDGVSKRVGLVRFECEFLIDGQMRSYDFLDERWEWIKKVKKVDLRDYFLGIVRTVYLE